MKYAIYNNGTRASKFYDSFDETYTELKSMYEIISDNHKKVSCLGYSSFASVYHEDINLYEISSR